MSVVSNLNLVFKSKPNFKRRHSQKLSAHFQHSVRIYVTQIESLTYKLSRFLILYEVMNTGLAIDCTLSEDRSGLKSTKLTGISWLRGGTWCLGAILLTLF